MQKFSFSSAFVCAHLRTKKPFWLFIGLCAVLLLAGCSVPRVIVLNDPLDARQHNDLGVAYQHRGEYDLARREYARAADLDPHWALPLVNRGNVFAAEGGWKEAAANYRRALKREPGNAPAMNNLGWALLQSGRAEEALPWAEKATAADPGEPSFLDTRADIHLALGEPEAARRLLEQALALSPPAELKTILEEKKVRLEIRP